MNIDAQSVPVFERRVAADPDHILIRLVREKDQIPAVRVRDKATLDLDGYSLAAGNVIEFDCDLSAIRWSRHTGVSL